MATEMRLQLTNEEALFARVEELTRSVDTLAAEVLALKESQGRSFARFDEMVNAGSELFEKVSQEGLGAILGDMMKSRRRRKKGGEIAAPDTNDA